MLSIATIAYGIEDVPEIAGMTREMILNIAENTTSSFEQTIIFNGQVLNLGKSLSYGVVAFSEHQSIATCYNAAFNLPGGEFLCCCHNDVKVERGWSESLIEIAEGGDIAFPQVEEVRYADKVWPLGSACFVLSRKLWEELDGYDERFKGCHYEDEDLFLRAMRLGVKLVQSQDSKVKHLRRVTRSLVPFKQDEKWIAMNHPVFVAKHGDEGVNWLKSRWGKMERE